MKTNLVQLAKIMNVGLFIISLIILPKSPILAIACLAWSFYYYTKCDKYMSTIKPFTLLELIAVIAVMGILLSITLTIKTDTMKADAMNLKSQLMQAQTYSYENSTLITSFDMQDNFHNDIIESHDVYFKSGVPVDEYGNNLIGVKFTITDTKGNNTDIILYVKPFTGKLTFY